MRSLMNPYSSTRLRARHFLVAPPSPFSSVRASYCLHNICAATLNLTVHPSHRIVGRPEKFCIRLQAEKKMLENLRSEKPY